MNQLRAIVLQYLQNYDPTQSENLGVQVIGKVGVHKKKSGSKGRKSGRPHKKYIH
jgi:hypothetical protein